MSPQTRIRWVLPMRNYLLLAAAWIHLLPFAADGTVEELQQKLVH
jgi:hypothetical protein